MDYQGRRTFSFVAAASHGGCRCLLVSSPPCHLLCNEGSGRAWLAFPQPQPAAGCLQPNTIQENDVVLVYLASLPGKLHHVRAVPPPVRRLGAVTRYPDHTPPIPGLHTTSPRCSDIGDSFLVVDENIVVVTACKPLGPTVLH